MRQTDAILAALRDGDTLTPHDARRVFGCDRLAARIGEARAMLTEDEEIVTEWQSANGARFARYRLVRRTPPRLPPDGRWEQTPDGVWERVLW